MLYLVCLELNTQERERERERDMKNVFRKNKQASRSAAMASHCNHVLPQRSLANQNHLSQHDLSHMLYNYIIICCLSLSVSLWKCVTAVYGHPPGLRHKPGGTSLCIYASIGRTPHVPGIGISLLRPIPSHLFFIYHVGSLHRW